jgi:hypothetical protein
VSITLNGVQKAEAALPAKYKDFADVFSEENTDILAPHRDHDYAIVLQEERQPPKKSIYAISATKRQVLRK